MLKTFAQMAKFFPIWSHWLATKDWPWLKEFRLWDQALIKFSIVFVLIFYIYLKIRTITMRTKLHRTAIECIKCPPNLTPWWDSNPRLSVQFGGIDGNYTT
jgi:hypothetical protein